MAMCAANMGTCKSHAVQFSDHETLHSVAIYHICQNLKKSLWFYQGGGGGDDCYSIGPSQNKGPTAPILDSNKQPRYCYSPYNHTK